MHRYQLVAGRRNRNDWSQRHSCTSCRLRAVLTEEGREIYISATNTTRGDAACYTLRSMVPKGEPMHGAIEYQNASQHTASGRLRRVTRVSIGAFHTQTEAKSAGMFVSISGMAELV